VYSRFLNRTLMAVMATVVVASACSKKDEVPKTAGSEMIVKIGQVSPLTGPQAHLGKDNDNGARLAIDEANARGVTLGGQKVKFVLLSEDDQADPRPQPSWRRSWWMRRSRA